MGNLLRISTFGGLQIQRGDELVTGLASRKAEALLVYLACTRRPHARENLATLLWDDRPQSRALGNLSVLLSSLRKHLTPYVIITRQTVGFNSKSNYWLDVAELEKQLFAWRELKTKEITTLHTAVEALEEALILVQGGFLAGFHIRDSRDFNEWALIERERLRHQVLGALEELVIFHRYSRHYKKGIEFARRLLELDPLQEEVHRQLMLLLARSGQRSAALCQYSTCKRILAEELGVEPARNTRDLYLRIRMADQGLRHNLPPQTTHFVGREAELAQIGDRLADPNCRLLTIIGPGGIGKTRLVIQAAEGWVDDFLNGVFFVTLASVSGTDNLVSAIADALKISFYPGENTKQQLLDYLREKEMLLVLDNFEHLLSGVGLLANILREANEVKLLVTSRERLNLQEEWLLALEGLAYPKTIRGDWIEKLDIEPLESFSAVQLFINNARKVHADFALEREERHGISRVCQAVEGMPLGIELASSWVQIIPCQEIAREIEENLDFLATTLRNIPTRHRNMRAVFDHSWNMLTEGEKRVFRKLSVFQGGFTREAASQVAGVTLVVLSSLVEKSLIRRSGTQRYELHELLRQYAEKKLKEYPGEDEAVLELHCEYFAEFLHQQENTLFTSGQQLALQEITEEFENIRAAWRWAAKNVRVAELNQASLAIWYFCEVRTRHQDAIELGRLAEEALRTSGLAGPPAGETDSAYAWSLFFTGFGYLWHAQYEKAQEVLKESLEVAETAGDNFLIALMLNYLGLIAVFTREKGARELLERGLAIVEEENIPWFKRFLLHNLGLDACNWGEYGKARQFFLEQISFYKSNASPRTLAGSHKGLGNVAYEMGDYSEARRNYKKAVEGLEIVGDRRLTAEILNRLAHIAYIDGDYTKAKDICLESLAIVQDLGIRLLITSTLIYLGYASYALGEPEEALANFQEALKTAMEIHVPFLALEALPGIALIQARDGDVTRAIELLALAIHHRESNQETKERATQLLSRLEGDLSQQALAAAQVLGKSRELEDVAKDLLGSGLASPPSVQ